MACPCYAGGGPGGGGPEPLYCIDGGNNVRGVSGTACCGQGFYVTPGPIGSPVHPMCQGQGCDWLANNSTCFDNTAPDDGNDPNLTLTKIDKFDLIGGEKAPGDIGYDPFTDGSNIDSDKISKIREFIKEEIKKSLNNKNHDLDFLERLPIGKSVDVGVIIKGKYRKRNGGMYDEPTGPDEYKKVFDHKWTKNGSQNDLISTKELSKLIDNNNAIEDRANKAKNWIVK